MNCNNIFVKISVNKGSVKVKKVSIIMPVYNGKEFLSESIESILNQSYTDFEFIIVNEFGSNDGSDLIIQNYAKKDNRIIFIQNGKREGIAESLNIALRKAKGKYIARMDSDDISMPDRISEQVSYLEKNPEIGLCGIQPTFFGTQKMEWKVSTDPIYIKNSIFFYSPCVHPTIMFRSELVKKYDIFYNKNYKASEDYDFLAKFAKVTLISNINNPKLFKYRLHNTNATYENNEVGLKNYSQIMSNLFKEQLKLDFTDEEINLLNCHISLNPYSENELFQKYLELDKLLKMILVNSYYNDYNVSEMFNVLRNRFFEIKNCINSKNLSNKELINFYLDVSIFNNDTFDKNFVKNPKSIEPQISVLLPVYNSQDYILDSILSILNQTFTNFELLILYEAGITDRTLDYINIIDDKRIRIIKNKTKLGLAGSLNAGIKQAKGKYIARIDSDDISKPDRFTKQYEFLEKHPNIDICSTWQQHFGPNYTWIHETPYENEKIKALLLFECCICHSTVMFRKDKFIKNNLFYRTDIRQEDFELWCRASDCCNFAVIQEILGLYRLHSSNITFNDLNNVSNCQVEIVKNNLKKLKINTQKYKNEVYVGFQYLYDDIPNLKKEAFALFDEIIRNNKKLHVFDEESLEYAIKKRKNWINKNDSLENNRLRGKIPFKCLIKEKIKKILYPVYKRFKNRMIMISQNQIEQNNTKYNLNNINKKVDNLEQLIKELYSDEKLKLLNDKLNMLESFDGKNYIDYKKGEKIRITFLMHAASFWPSFESVFHELINDTRFEFKIFLFPKWEKEKSQFSSCKNFLEKNKIKYELLTMEKLLDFNPHIAIMQTPYDKWHREREFYAKNLKKKGIRLVYIPYGIEFSNLSDSIDFQFGSEFINSMWKVYTINKYTKEKYCIFSTLPSTSVKDFGNPKFDGLYTKKTFVNINFREKANGKKIVLVKIHFPLTKNENGLEVLYTPNLQIYIDLLKNIDVYNDFYFIFMLHPKMFDNQNINGIKELKNLLNGKENVYIYKEDDYRCPMYQSDFFICDRSALAIEIGIFNKPVLYLENECNHEEYIECFENLINTYIKGSSYDDIEKFLEKCRQNLNIDTNARENAVNKIVKTKNGKIGKLIVDDLYNSIIEEE